MKRRVWRGMPVDYSYTYPRVWWPDHPLASSNGMVKIHRAVMSEVLGRVLSSDEFVHHKNEDKLDWNPDNLEVMSAAEHNITHAQNSGQQRTCAFCGTVLHVYKSRTVYQDSFCNAVCQKQQRIKDSDERWPDDRTLHSLIWDKPASQVAASLNVSSSMVRKRCRQRGIPTPPRGFWSKKCS